MINVSLLVVMLVFFSIFSIQTLDLKLVNSFNPLAQPNELSIPQHNDMFINHAPKTSILCNVCGRIGRNHYLRSTDTATHSLDLFSNFFSLNEEHR